jgi:ribosomal protection tetracycline resistance protein
LRTLTVGVVAHVDAGKTSLTERLLFETGVLDRLGRVDDGDTQTDTMALERERGITIRSAVATFAWRDAVVNLLDTPGHSDFVAEVERALAVLDAAVLVISAVEGVQAQTLVLMRALQRLGLPAVLFVNKVDRAGADPERVLTEAGARLTPDAVPLGLVADPGTRNAAYQPFDTGALERDSLRARTLAGTAYPVVFGSAVTGVGVPELLDVLVDLASSEDAATQDNPAGVVFKLERTESGQRRAFVRMTAGTLRVRDRVALDGREPERVTGIEVFEPGGPRSEGEASTGQIAVVRGWSGARVGDRFGDETTRRYAVELTRPSLETVVEPVDPTMRGRLFTGLTDLAEQDPLIALRQDDGRGEVAVSLYGEVQKEVIAALLERDHGVSAVFRPTTAICVERVRRVGAAHQLIGVAPNPFLAQLGLRVEPAPVDSGLELGLEVELGSMPPAFFAATEEGVRATLSEGVHGWAVPDARVVVTHSGYYPRQSAMHATFDKSMSSTAQDFRSLAKLLLAEALVRAGTTVCGPVHRFELEVPQDLLGVVLAELPRHQAVPLTTTVLGGDGVENAAAPARLVGELPADEVHGLARRLPHLTRGEGLLTTRLDHYAPVTGAVPERSRALPDPFTQIRDWTRIQRSWPAG